MKGKKILLLTAMFSMLAVVAGVFGLGFKINAKTAPMAEAKEIAGFSQAYDKTTDDAKDVIFSVEKVYFAEQVNRGAKLTYNGYDFKSMQNHNNDTWYYGDYYLRDENVAYDNKYIVKNNDFVMVDDTKTLNAETTDAAASTVSIKEGVLLTLGGYYYSDTDISNNASDKGANLEFVSITAWRNTDETGTPITLNGNRTYNSKYYDFVWFLEANESTEGKYHLKIEYMQTNGNKQTQYFDFTLLLSSKYEGETDVNGQRYSNEPVIEYATGGNRNYTFLKDMSNQYPTLTFDYTRYNMKYTYVTGDETRDVTFNYNQGVNSLELTTRVYNENNTKSYPIKFADNRFVTLMFTGIGEYTFEFDYAYNTANTSTVVKNLTVDNIKLSIKGYQLKYSKLGFASADMERLEVAQNGTMCIVVDGYTDAETIANESLEKGSDLGVNYVLTTDGGRKTGSVINRESACSDNFTEDNYDFTNKVYQTTNQGGLWLTLNGEYDFGEVGALNSYYYYNINKFESLPETDKKQPFTKVTTFSEKGYYLVKVAYKLDENQHVQYLAFEITASTPQMDMKLTGETDSSKVKEDDAKFYSHQYTNKNVYATWSKPNTFEAKLYATVYKGAGDNKYASEQVLLDQAKKVANSSNIQSFNYNQKEILTESGSYLLCLEVENSSTKVFSYFIIDKDKITGLEVYRTAKYYVGKNVNYEVARDSNLNYITYTSSPIIDVDFIVDWAKKPSGANINATYQFAPFVKQNSFGSPIESGADVYQPNYYKLGEFSNPITIQKHQNLATAIDSNIVLTSQGIYIFKLEDEAGNELTYFVVLDRTEGIINATIGEDGVESGSTVTEDINIAWGTHKAIDIETTNDDVNRMLQGSLPEHYYSEGQSNKYALSNIFYQDGDNSLLLVENKYSQISVLRDNNNRNIYELQSNGNKIIRNQQGQIVGYWDGDDFAKNRFNSTSSNNVTIRLDENKKISYKVELFGANIQSGSSNTSYVITLNPDIAKGEVYSTSNEGVYDNEVYEVGVSTQYFEVPQSEEKDKYINIKDQFGSAQLSDDRLFVFEWSKPKDAGVQVVRVWYNYYRLMSEDELNRVTDINSYPYYPYVYDKTIDILKLDGENEVVSNYTQFNSGEEVRCQSNPLNVGYETYYLDGELVSKTVTKSGLYIITRELNSDTKNVKEFSYAFMVDRNQIIEYSIGSSKEKLVGEFIHANLQDVKFDNFSIQGLREYEEELGEKNTLRYKVYAETNKLPTEIKVPTGKYITVNAEGNLQYTSYNSSYLKLTVYFKDTYNILQSNTDFIKLMTGDIVKENGTISLNFVSNKDFEQAYITLFKNARIHQADNYLSLPGTYVFVIQDTVGKILNEEYDITDNNSLIIGVKLTNNKPTTDVYTFAEINQQKSDNVYSENFELYTNQEFVEFVIPAVDANSHNAQLDLNNFVVKRDGVVWLQKSNGEFIINLSGQEASKIAVTQGDGSVIVKLDTGLVVENGVIVSYEQYHYEIEIQYILKDKNNNDLTQYYIYNQDGEKQFCKSMYNVHIDRSPETNNISNILSDQNLYFNTYLKNLAVEYGLINSIEDNFNINDNFAYRSTTYIQDYYGYSNNLYYKLLNYLSNNQGLLKNVNPSMYAITIDDNTALNKDGLAKMYYREIDIDTTIDSDSRMGLLPICDTYFSNSSGFYLFSQNNVKYFNIQNFNINSNNTYKALLGDRYQPGKIYEIVEVDQAGNLTQYVIYCKPQSNDVSITVEGDLIDLNENKTVSFNSENNQRSFSEITSVTISGLGQSQSNNYGKLEIVDGLGRIKLLKYINSTTTNDSLNQDITDIVKVAGNYTIKYTNIYNEESTIFIDNYAGKNLRLNITALVLQTEKIEGGERHYIDIANVNTTIDNTNLVVYAKTIEIYRGNECAKYTGKLDSGRYIVSEDVGIDGLTLDGTRIILGGAQAQFTIKITSSLGKVERTSVSTNPDAYQYKLDATTNYYAKDNVIYTAGDVKISYYNVNYNSSILVYVDEQNSQLSSVEAKKYYQSTTLQDYSILTLKSAEEKWVKYIVEINERNENTSIVTYTIVIDTRTTNFDIKTINLEDMSEYVSANFNSSTDFDINSLVDNKYYKNLIPKTVNIGWTIRQSEYFNYKYELIEYYNSATQSYKYLVNDDSVEKYQLRPKAPTQEEPTTGKYLLKVTIRGKNDVWIASKIFTMRLTTTISSLYDVKDGDSNIYNYSTITNLNEIKNEIGFDNLNGDQKLSMAKALGFADTSEMDKVFNGFGHSTAVPMYISIKDLDVHTNEDEGVYGWDYSFENITLYKIESSNYRTFVVIVKVEDAKGNLLTDETLNISTNASENKTYLISRTMVTVHEPKATKYVLNFQPFNINGDVNLRFKTKNKIIIDIYYNDTLAKSIQGEGTNINQIEFKTAGTYTLKIRDLAGNYQKFGAGDSVVVKIMKGVLFTINDEAPIQFAYYDKQVKLTINANTANSANYENTSIKLTAYLNNSSEEYTDYEKNSNTYIFSQYGTYVINITARLSNSEYEVSSQIVFTILNPNEARTALDFTAISNYTILSIVDISAGDENAKDVTKSFMELFNGQVSQDGILTYSKLITHEKLVGKFGASQGKMKFVVKYKVYDDDLLPAREVSFAFTSNNEVPTITCSVDPGTKTTKGVKIKYNTWIIYQQMGECNLVVNDVVVLRIDATTAKNEIEEKELKTVGKYYITIQGDSGNVATSVYFTIKEPLNTMSIILIVIVVGIVIGLIITFIWLRTKMKVR